MAEVMRVEAPTHERRIPSLRDYARRPRPSGTPPVPDRPAAILRHPTAVRAPALSSALPTDLDLSMRMLRAVIAVAHVGSVHKAAALLHVTQPAVTRAIRECERTIGHDLFERTPKGMVLTPVGAILVERATRAMAQLTRAEQDLIALGLTRRSSASISAKITHRHLRTLLAVHEHQTETAAAAQLGVSQPAVTQILRGLERIVETDLFVRTARGMLPTPAGEFMVQRARLLYHELKRAREDIADHLWGTASRIVIGASPLASTLLVPRAVTRWKQDHPEVPIVILEGAQESLLSGLRCGEIDIVVGALHDAASDGDVTQEMLLEDSLTVVARKDHPLASTRSLTLDDLVGAEWVLPHKEAPARKALEQAFVSAGLPPPRNSIESNTLTAMRTLLLESDRLSVLSRNQILYEELHGMLSVLPVDMRGGKRCIGMAMRTDSKRSAAVSAIVRHLKAVGEEMQYDGSLSTSQAR